MTCWYKQDMGNQGQQAFGGNKNRVLLWSMITTVAENADKYTKRAYRRAVEARRLQNIITKMKVLKPNKPNMSKYNLQNKKGATEQTIQMME